MACLQQIKDQHLRNVFQLAKCGKLQVKSCKIHENPYEV